MEDLEQEQRARAAALAEWLDEGETLEDVKAELARDRAERERQEQQAKARNIVAANPARPKPPAGWRWDKATGGQVQRKKRTVFTGPQIDVIVKLHALDYTPREIWGYLVAQPDGKDITLDAVKQRVKLGRGKLRPPRTLTPEMVAAMLKETK